MLHHLDQRYLLAGALLKYATVKEKIVTFVAYATKQHD